MNGPGLAAPSDERSVLDDMLARLEDDNSLLRARLNDHAHTVPRMVGEIEAFWRFTERLRALGDSPRALHLVTRLAAELTLADAATIFLHAGSDEVVASRWGQVAVDLGLKAADVRRLLELSFRSSIEAPLCHGAREIGCLWVGRTDGRFAAHEQMILKTIASVASLAVTALRARSRHRDASTADAPAVATVEAATVEAHLDAAADTAAVPAAFVRVDAQRLALPAFPSSLARLMTTLDETTDAKAIEAAVALDPTLAALVIRTVGSAAAGQARPARHLRDAVLVLGSRGVRNLAVTQLARGLLAQREPIDMLLWEQSIGTAVRAQAALEVVGHQGSDNGYIAGLLHNVGAIALHEAYPSEYERVLKTSLGKDRPIADVERETFAVDGDELTRRLLAEWHLPETMTSLLRSAEGTIERAVFEWARHATLVENDGWRAFAIHVREDARVPWLTARAAHAAAGLGLSDAEIAALEQLGRSRVGSTRRLLRNDGGPAVP